MQAWDDDAVHAAHVAVRVGRDATFRSMQATLGGSAVRVLETVEYAGPGGDAELLGVFFADAGQHLEHRMFVDHAVPHCRSNVLYKGALQGDPEAGDAGIARSVWIGDVLIRAAAVGTETYELNRNLLLTEAARADSVPNLEIETGEIVGAGHASATGRFDDEQLFYLQSRGIPADVATRLVVRGFFADVIARLGLPEWEQQPAVDRIDAELGSGDRAPSDATEVRRVSAVEVCKLVDVPVARRAGASSSTARPWPSCATPTASVHAIRDICSHADVALSEGEVDGCTLECWLHGSRFDLRTGRAHRPARHRLRPRLPR